MRLLVTLVGVAGLALAATPPAPRLESVVTDPALSSPPAEGRFNWHPIYVDEHTGAPRTIPMPAVFGMPLPMPVLARNPAEMRAVYLIQNLTSERDVDRFDSVVRRAWEGELPLNFTGEGWHDGGGQGIYVNAYHVVRFSDQYDGMSEKYPDEAFEMPLAEFLPLWRDWAASVRLYNQLLERYGVDDRRQDYLPRVLPREHWPKAYPPSNEA